MRAALRTVPALLLLSILPRSAVAGADRWAPLGPDGGAIWSLAADPDRPGTVYAGTFAGGVWTSSDGGGHWSPTPEGLGDATVFSIGVSPGRVWAGTTGGLFVLTEGAPTWRSVSPTPDGWFGSVAVDPTNPDRIWTLSDSGAVWLSQDGGDHWERTLHLKYGFATLAVAATTPPTLYVAGSEGLYASTDAGATWRQALVFDAYALALDPEDPKTLYASSSSGIWKTTDQGRTGSYLTDFSPRPLLVLPGVLLGSDLGLWRSEDDGATWTREPELANPIIRSMAADPFTPGGAWIGTEGQGVFRTLDGGRSVVPSRRGLGASDVYTFAFDPFQLGTFYTANWAGFQRSVDAGASWSRLVARPYLSALSLAADPRQPGLLYAGTIRGVFVSRDRGAHWQRSLADFDVEAVAVDPLQPGVVYAAGERLWRSRNGGRTWKLLPSPVFPGNVAIKIAFSPHRPGTLYLFDAGGGGVFYPGSLSRSTDGGDTWKRIVRSGASSLAFDPRTPDLLYLGTRTGAIRRSRDGGRTWEHVSHVVPDDSFNSILTALLVDPEDPAVLYAGSAGRGVWRSKDQGVTWEPLASGMIAPTITCLEADPRDRRHLIACTLSGGLMDIRLQP